jgi:hypothetical protein
MGDISKEVANTLWLQVNKELFFPFSFTFTAKSFSCSADWVRGG